MRYLLSLLLLLTAIPQATAQELFRFRHRADVPVTTPAGTLQNPWSGGLNTAQYSTIDLNKDGRDDLFIFDRMLRKVYTYLAVQQGGEWRYAYAPEYEAMFPEGLENWVLLRDYNCDGLKDIFTSTSLGIRVYRQEATNDKFPTFTLAEDALFYRSRNGQNNVNMQMNGGDIPAIVDMDGDGDLDILLTEFSGGYTLEYYQNMQVEDGTACGSLRFALNTDWWGQITECEGCNTYGFGIQCRVAAPLHSGHDGSSLLVLDLNGDGVKDLLIGAVECEDLVMMENKGTSTLARMESFSPLFPNAANPASFRLFPAAYYEDVTFDGIPDLLVAPNSNENHGRLELQRSSWLYQNTGTAHAPVFDFVANDFLQQQQIDLGEGAYPAFADISGDGLPDMLVGNNRANRHGHFVGTLSYYRNTGTATEPAFALETDDYLGLSARNMQFIRPAFSDLTRDGKPDLVLSYIQAPQHAGGGHHHSSVLHVGYIANTAGAGQPYAFEAAGIQMLHHLTQGDAPVLYDVSGDGLPDLLVGTAGGALDYYRNTGNNTFALEKQALGGINYDFMRRNVSPTVADLSGNGKPDLLTTDDSGVLRLYPDFTDNLNGNFTAITDLLENDLTNQLLPTRFGRTLQVAVGALGGPNKLYLAVGTLGGGLYLLEQAAGNTGNPVVGQQGLGLKVYPNPAQGVSEPVQVRAAEPVSVVLHDMVGRRVHVSEGSHNRRHTLSLGHLPAGVYLLRATSRAGRHETRKLVLQ